MNKLLILVLTLILVVGCANKKQPPITTNTVNEVRPAARDGIDLIASYPRINDTAEFINTLRSKFKLAVHESPVQKAQERITSFDKVRLYGSSQDYYLIEYDWKVGSMAEFPWKHQLLLTKSGELVSVFNAYRFKLVTIFPNQPPLLLLTIVSARGNGGHRLYKLTGDSVENIYDGYKDYAVQTYDRHEDRSIYEPFELSLNIKDINKDGFADIFFSGTEVFLQKQTKDGFWYDSETVNGKTITYSSDNPSKKLPLGFIFLYDKSNGHFKAVADYSRK